MFVHRVVLIFPDTVRILAFIMECKVGGIEINSHFLTVTGKLTGDQIKSACNQYGG